MADRIPTSPEWRPLLAADMTRVLAISALVHPDLPERLDVLDEKRAQFPEGCLGYGGTKILGYGLAHPWMLDGIPALDEFLGGLPQSPDCLHVHDVALLLAARGQGGVSRYIAAMAALARSRGLCRLPCVAVYGAERLGRRSASKRSSRLPRNRSSGPMGTERCSRFAGSDRGPVNLTLPLPPSTGHGCWAARVAPTMRHWDYKDWPDPSDVLDPALRKNVFRAMARDFTGIMKTGLVTDRPGTIARMMEAAYRAGLGTPRDADVAASGVDQGADHPRRFTDMDVPSFPRQCLRDLRSWLFDASPYDGKGGYPRNGSKEPGQEQITLVMRPGIRGMPSRLSRDEWMLAVDDGRRSLTNKAILPLVKLDLYRATVPHTNGWRCAVLTEWGFELLATGETAMPDARGEGTSSTASRYRACVGNGGLLQAAITAMGLLEDEEPWGARPR